MSFGLPELAAAVRQFMAENLPGRTPLRVAIFTAEDAKPLSLPVPAAPAAPPAFIPTAFQTAILDALDGRALRTEALAAAVGGDRRRLFRKPGGLTELREKGMVDQHPRLGYFRPDSPPEELAGEGE